MRSAKWICVAVALCLAGCQTRFQDDRTIEFVANGDIRTLIVDAQPDERTLSVAAKSNKSIDVYIYLEENQEEAERMITLQKPSPLVLAQAENATAIDLTAKLPANKSACVMFHADGPETTVDLSMHD